MKAHTSKPVLASMACSIPSFAPTQMIDRRFL